LNFLFFFQRKEVRLMLNSPRETGQGLVEYTLLLVFLAIAVLLTLFVLGPILGNVFTKIGSQLKS
jgi:Flp pilus assembly pilin Flp